MPTASGQQKILFWDTVCAGCFGD